MQKGVRVDEGQLLLLGTRARTDHSIAGNLYKKSSDNVKWKQRWFTLYQNLLFFYENDSTLKPLGVILLEGCYSERQAPPKLKEDKQVSKRQKSTVIFLKTKTRVWNSNDHTCTTHCRL